MICCEICGAKKNLESHHIEPQKNCDKFKSIKNPHIKRNEYILKSFELGSDVLSHNYNILTNNNNPTLDDIGEFEFLPNFPPTPPEAD